MNSNDLFDAAASVETRVDFLGFLQALEANRQNNPEDWENATLQDYLQGFSAFSRDIEGYYKNAGETVDVSQLTWRMLAQMLLAATVYTGD